MGCGCSVGTLTKDQLDNMFDFGAREMMKRCLISAYAQKDNMKVKAPTQEMVTIRKMADTIHKWSDQIKDKLEASQDKLADKLDEGADKVKGMVGNLFGNTAAAVAGAAADAASAVADKTTDVAASVTGFMLEKGLLGVASGLDAAIAAIDAPFEAVGKDIFNAKKNEIIKCYCDIIDGEKCKIAEPQNAVRGADPWGEAEYKACQADLCVRTMQKQCTETMQVEMHKVVQEEINKHTVTSVWDTLIKTYNSCILELNKIADQYEILKGLERDPIKLDIGTYIVNQVIIEFYILMMQQEVEIRKEPTKFSQKTAMPELFHLLFSGNPGYHQFTISHYANMTRRLGVPSDA